MGKSGLHKNWCEIELLQRFWKSPKAEMLILYGRRRVGKTRLLTHWLKIEQPRALFWVGEPTSAFDQLRYFSQAVYNFANSESPVKAGRPEFSRLDRVENLPSVYCKTPQ
jgi:hypothetical protein